jgi:diaminopimelate decarboxylase
MNDCLDYSTYSSLASEHGSSFFILDPAKLRSNYTSLVSAFKSHYHKIKIAYSYKTNYTPQICQILHEQGAWAEVVSEMEYSAALNLGISKDKIIFNGPYKADWAFRDAALGGSILNLDSHRDLGLLSTLSTCSLGQTLINVVLRCNFPIDKNISRFGFDAECPDFYDIVHTISNLRNVRLIGLHCHFPNRNLASFRKRAECLVSLCSRLFPKRPPAMLNIGGGFFSSLPESISRNMSESPATFLEYGSIVGEIFSRAFGHSSDAPTLILEPGTALVADVMNFYTQVISIKTIRGKHFATVAGSIFDISPNAKSRCLPVQPILAPDVPRGVAREYIIAGFTCIEGDVLTESLISPLTVGDVLAYGNVGSYSVVMRPPFILPSNPILMKRTDDTCFDLVKARQSNESVFSLFKCYS